MDFLEPTHNYDIGHTKFTKDQVDAIEFALTRYNCILGLQPGMGKTNCSLRVMMQIISKVPRTMVFIVCPKEANSSFKKELSSRFHLPYSMCTTEESFINKKARFIIFNYTTVSKMKPFLDKCRDSGWKSLLIADEVHLMGSSSSNMSKVLKSYRGYFTMVLGLTGTPVLNALEGVWRIMDFVRPGSLGKYNQFRYYFIDYVKKNIRMGARTRVIEEVVGYKHIDELRYILSNYIISRGKQYNVEFLYKQCVLTDDEMAEYEKAAMGVLESDDQKQYSSRLHDLQRIADGSHHLLSKDRLYSKVKLLLKTVAEIISRGEGVLIYTEYEDTYKELEEVFKKYKQYIGYRRLMFITGKTSYKDRVNVEKVLTHKDIVIVTKAGSKAINLQAVNNVVFYDIPFSIGDFIQMSGRVTRIDTEYNKQNLYILEVSQTIDTYKRILLQSHANLIKDLFGSNSTLPYTKGAEEDMVKRYRQYFKNKFLWCR